MDSHKIGFSELESQTIEWLRFPLIMCVLLIHTQLGNIMIQGQALVNQAEYPFFTHFSFLFSEEIARLAVPLFFFFSGFLFFRGSELTITSWFEKIRKRIKTLLVPYLIWNALYLLFYFLGEQVVPQMFSGRYPSISDTSLFNLVTWFWNRADGMPLDQPLWFIRDLMVVNLFAYVIFRCIKRFRFDFLLFLGLLWLFDKDYFPVGVNPVAFFFFSLGAYSKIMRIDLLKKIRTFGFLSLCVYLFIIVVLLFHCSEDTLGLWLLHSVGKLFGMVAVLWLTSSLIARFHWKENVFLSKSVFFLFAFHIVPLTLVIKFAFKVIPVYSEGTLLAIYLLSPAITAVVGLSLYALLKRYLPKLSVYLTGGR